VPDIMPFSAAPLGFARLENADALDRAEQVEVAEATETTEN
jgi:hypothetical protein